MSLTDSKRLIERIISREAAMSYNPMSYLSISDFYKLLDAAREEGREDASYDASLLAQREAQDQ